MLLVSPIGPNSGLWPIVNPVCPTVFDPLCTTEYRRLAYRLRYELALEFNSRPPITGLPSLPHICGSEIAKTLDPLDFLVNGGPPALTATPTSALCSYSRAIGGLPKILQRGTLQKCKLATNGPCDPRVNLGSNQTLVRQQ